MIFIYASGIPDSGIEDLALSDFELKDAIVDKYCVLTHVDFIQVELVLSKDERQVRIILVQDI